MNANLPDAAANPAPSRRRRGRVALLAALVVASLLFVGLTVWQIERRTWKLALIDRVEQRVHAAAVDAPGPQRWSQVDAADDAYRHVRVTGRLLAGHDTRVQAVTALGSGWWLLTPLQKDDGTIVLVNRGYVPQDAPAVPTPDAACTVTGLLRITEPGGGFMRRNDAAGNRWFSRDVQAIAAARGLRDVAPYFIDAEAGSCGSRAAGFDEGTASAGSAPVGGLTVVSFYNHHLLYAFVWGTLAAMTAWAVVKAARASPGDDDGE